MPSPQSIKVGCPLVVIIILEIKVPVGASSVQNIGDDVKSNRSQVICCSNAKLLISPSKSTVTLSSEPEGRGGIVGVSEEVEIEFCGSITFSSASWIINLSSLFEFKDVNEQGRQSSSLVPLIAIEEYSAIGGLSENGLINALGEVFLKFFMSIAEGILLASYSRIYVILSDGQRVNIRISLTYLAPINTAN